MYAYDRRRVEALRQAAVEPAICYDGFYLAFFEHFHELGPASADIIIFPSCIGCYLDLIFICIA